MMLRFAEGDGDGGDDSGAVVVVMRCDDGSERQRG